MVHYRPEYSHDLRNFGCLTGLSIRCFHIVEILVCTACTYPTDSSGRTLCEDLIANGFAELEAGVVGECLTLRYQQDGVVCTFQGQGMTLRQSLTPLIDPGGKRKAILVGELLVDRTELDDDTVDWL
ncbi:hypothetical protein EB835_06470 [Brevibacterium sp. S22]|nr:hypothetical protein EB835_06470 [Brevibacterium sp. S22]